MTVPAHNQPHGYIGPPVAHYVENMPNVENMPMELIIGLDATCPHCWEIIQLRLDLSVDGQSYIEDCPVCCKPMSVCYAVVDGEVTEFTVEDPD